MTASRIRSARSLPEDLRFPDLSAPEGSKPVKADAAGNFEILQLSPGAFEVHAASRRSSASVSVELEEGSERYLDILLEEGLTVSGRVVDPSGRPVEGAIVNVWGGDLCWARSDEDGLFAVHAPGFPRGRGIIEASRFGLHGPRLFCDVPSSGNVITMAPAPVIAGRVSARERENIPPCRVTAVRMDGKDGEFWGSPDAAGRFTAALPPGRYFLHAEAEDFTGTRLHVDLAPGERREVVLELVRSGSVRVRLDMTGSGKDGGEVYIECPSCAPLSEMTDFPGEITFEDIPPGPVSVVAVARDHGLARLDGIQVTAGTTSEVTLSVPAIQGIFGQVTRRGEPIEGARVLARGPGGSHLTGTSLGGWFQIEELEAGAYEVHVEDSATRSEVVTQGRATRLWVELAATLVSGTVTAGGRPASGMPVEATGLLDSTGLLGSSWSHTTETNAAGEWSLQLPAPEEYIVDFGKGGATRSLVLEEGQGSAGLDVTLESLPLPEPEEPDAPDEEDRSEDEN